MASENENHSRYGEGGLSLSSVFVAIRVRPISNEAAGSSGSCLAQRSRTQLAIACPTDDTVDTKHFSYDYVFGQDSKQQELYDVLGTKVLENALQGYNGCLFAYGQTGSGKTFTVLGQPQQPGIIPRFCCDLFGKLDEKCRTQASDERLFAQTEVEYFEIYGEKVRDLLDAKAEGECHRDLRVREHPKRGPYIEGLTRVTVNSAQQIQQLMEVGSRSRVTAATNMNDVSSRSHAICRITIHLTKMVPSMDKPGAWHVISDTTSLVSLVDLAGSERIKESGAEGVRMKEAVSINSSLTSLGRVISELAKGNHLSDQNQQHIPYRNCKLTWLLRDSLGGNSKTCMVATVSPVAQYYHETMSTLRYASMCKKIKNKAIVNEDPNARRIRELQTEIRMLRLALQDLSQRRAMGTLNTSTDSYSMNEQFQAIERAVQLNCQMVDQLQGLWEGRNMEDGRITSLDGIELRMREMENQPGFTSNDPVYSQLNEMAAQLRQQRTQEDHSLNEKARVLEELEREKQAVAEATKELEAIQETFAKSRAAAGMQLDATSDELELSRFRACNMKAVSMHRDQVLVKVSKRHAEAKRKLEKELQALEDELKATLRDREDLLALKGAKEALGAPVTARSRNVAAHLASPMKRGPNIMGASPLKSSGSLSYRKHPSNLGPASPPSGGTLNRFGVITSPSREARPAEESLREFLALPGGPAEGTQRHHFEAELIGRIRGVQHEIDQGREALTQLNLNSSRGNASQTLSSARSRGKSAMLGNGMDLESDGSTNCSTSTSSSHRHLTQSGYNSSNGSTGMPSTSSRSGYYDPILPPTASNNRLNYAPDIRPPSMTVPAPSNRFGTTPVTPPHYNGPTSTGSAAFRSSSQPCFSSSSIGPSSSHSPAPGSHGSSSIPLPLGNPSAVQPNRHPTSIRSVSQPVARATSMATTPKSKKKGGFFGALTSLFSRPKKIHYPDPAQVPEFF